MRWHLLLEEYGPKFYYLKGPRNIVADALSRVPTTAISSLNHTPSTTNNRPLPQPSSVSPCNKTLDELTIDTLAEGLLAMPAYEAHKSEAVPDPTALWQDCCLFHPRFDAHGNHPFHFRPSIIINKMINHSSKLSLKRLAASSNRPSGATTLYAFDSRQHRTRHGTSLFLMPCSTRWSPGIMKPLSTPLVWTALRPF